jgi:photosystem II stability/assembly factor-like uncharacterized protein
MEPDDEVHSPLRLARVGRALALMVMSVLAIGLATLGYAHPQLSFGSGKAPASIALRDTSYRLAAIDFVDASTGWVVAELPFHDFVVLHTTNAGQRWMQQLAGSGGDVGEYAHFERGQGVLVTLGWGAAIFQTDDGGKTWRRRDVEAGGGDVLSADFIDGSNGWLLVQTTAGQALYRTSDAGATWRGLGDPVSAGDEALRIAFSGPLRGWLYSLSAKPYAYTTSDGGATWSHVRLPVPGAARAPAPMERFFVAAQPTLGAGVAAIVVPISPPNQRSADGWTVIGYPPLTVRAFDGGGAVDYAYATFADSSPYRYTDILSEAGDGALPVAPGQVVLSSIDGGSSWRVAHIPAASGTVGYADAADWWWIDAGAGATSSDGGITWTRIRPLGTFAPLPGSLQVVDADHAWFGTIVDAIPLLETTSDGGHEWTSVRLPAIVSTQA